ncbi:RluA family pseudouridine synthase [Halalkalibacter akibai]|uniref:Pseudouridine synthase n=1 Tax=Halalkalibacter akibai (strain ATCC 43226 / DSM 21942 / CIP 109018 / JCM 9157 / 1139) TaxID=1236973 RepID=W4QYT8_HALA3|nr:RluA family pseudouridine synthase [Halalkalibacter akibai]GAE37067.1 pseudouridine synthase D [Halalkalibacter akibai JCM 9157]
MSNYVALLNWKVEDDWNNQLLRLFLKEKCHISKRALADIKFNDGLILVNNQEVTVRTTLRTGDHVQIGLPNEQISTTLVPEFVPLDIGYEDDHLLVVNKTAGMPTIPSREHPTGSLANAIIGYYSMNHHPATFHAVNRLDKDTSGLLIIAKHRLAHDRLSKLQQSGKVNRYYTAVVKGELPTNTGTIDAPIGRDPESIIKRMVTDSGKRAITHYSVVNQGNNNKVVEIKLETGRTHQIRVHFSYLGFPLLGDDLYGGNTEEIQRQALHCHKVEFMHPFTDELINISQGVPEDMRKLVVN